MIDKNKKSMKIIIGSDHVGLPLKNAALEYLKTLGMDIVDVGPFSGEEAVDYPDFAHLVAQKVLSGVGDSGILVCGTGLGMSIAANKVPGIRAALCHDPYTAHQARAHNDANVLCMGAWIVSPQRVGGILEEWIRTRYESGRHQPRLLKLENPAVTLPSETLPNLSSQGIKFGAALSPNRSVFGPLLFAGALEEGMQQAEENGFDVVELSLRDPADISKDWVQSLLSKYSLNLSAIATGQSCLHDAMCLASPDESGVQGAVRRIGAHIEFASNFGAAVIIGGIRGSFSGSESEKAAQHERALRTLATCADMAAVHGVQLLIEPVNRYETNFINTAEEAIQFIDKAGHPEIKLLLDTFHMNLEEVDIIVTLRKYSDRIGYIHFADSNRQAPGLGHFPFHQVMSTLLEIDYQGVITAEILPLPDDLRAIQQAGHFFKSKFSPENRTDPV